MGRWVQGLSPGAEFAVVVLGAFGLFFLVELLPQPAPETASRITNGELQFLAVYEIVIFVALAAFLSARGFTPKQLGLQPGLMDCAVGLGLALAMLAVAEVVEILFTALWPHADELINSATLATPGVSLAFLLRCRPMGSSSSLNLSGGQPCTAP